MQIQKILLCAVGLYFLYTGILSGSWGPALIGIGLAVIAFYVAFTGRVHKKFTRQTQVDQNTDPTDPARYRDPDDQQFLDLLHGIKTRFSRSKSDVDDSAGS